MICYERQLIPQEASHASIHAKTGRIGASSKSNWYVQLADREIPLQWRGHFDMLHDKRRNAAYADSIRYLKEHNDSIFSEKENLWCEVGCGSGLLSCLLARSIKESRMHGSVVAFECIPELAKIARDTVSRNGLESFVTVWLVHTSELDVHFMERSFGHRAIGVVSELLDTTLLGEGLVQGMQDAKRLLLDRKSPTRLIPSNGRVYLQGWTGSSIRGLGGPSCGEDVMKRLGLVTPAAALSCPGAASASTIHWLAMLRSFVASDQSQSCEDDAFRSSVGEVVPVTTAVIALALDFSDYADDSGTHVCCGKVEPSEVTARSKPSAYFSQPQQEQDQPAECFNVCSKSDHDGKAQQGEPNLLKTTKTNYDSLNVETQTMGGCDHQCGNNEAHVEVTTNEFHGGRVRVRLPRTSSDHLDAIVMWWECDMDARVGISTNPEVSAKQKANLSSHAQEASIDNILSTSPHKSPSPPPDHWRQAVFFQAYHGSEDDDFVSENRNGRNRHPRYGDMKLNEVVDNGHIVVDLCYNKDDIWLEHVHESSNYSATNYNHYDCSDKAITLDTPPLFTPSSIFPNSTKADPVATPVQDIILCKESQPTNCTNSAINSVPLSTNNTCAELHTKAENDVQSQQPMRKKLRGSDPDGGIPKTGATETHGLRGDDVKINEVRQAFVDANSTAPSDGAQKPPVRPCCVCGVHASASCFQMKAIRRKQYEQYLANMQDILRSLVRDPLPLSGTRGAEEDKVEQHLGMNVVVSLGDDFLLPSSLAASLLQKKTPKKHREHSSRPMLTSEVTATSINVTSEAILEPDESCYDCCVHDCSGWRTVSAMFSVEAAHAAGQYLRALRTFTRKINSHEQLSESPPSPPPHSLCSSDGCVPPSPRGYDNSNSERANEGLVDFVVDEVVPFNVEVEVGSTQHHIIRLNLNDTDGVVEEDDSSRAEDISAGDDVLLTHSGAPRQRRGNKTSKKTWLEILHDTIRRLPLGNHCSSCTNEDSNGFYRRNHEEVVASDEAFVRDYPRNVGLKAIFGRPFFNCLQEEWELEHVILFWQLARMISPLDATFIRPPAIHCEALESTPLFQSKAGTDSSDSQRIVIAPYHVDIYASIFQSAALWTHIAQDVGYVEGIDMSEINQLMDDTTVGQICVPLGVLEHGNEAKVIRVEENSGGGDSVCVDMHDVSSVRLSQWDARVGCPRHVARVCVDDFVGASSEPGWCAAVQLSLLAMGGGSEAFEVSECGSVTVHGIALWTVIGDVNSDHRGEQEGTQAGLRGGLSSDPSFYPEAVQAVKCFAKPVSVTNIAPAYHDPALQKPTLPEDEGHKRATEENLLNNVLTLLVHHCEGHFSVGLLT